MPIPYKIIEIFTSEQERWEGEKLYSAIVQQVNDLKIAARCIVTRGIEGSYENGEIATGRLEVLSYNMPVRIAIIVPAGEYDSVLARVNGMVSDGIVAVRDVEVVSHKTRGLLMPRQTRVRDVMTPDPKSVTAGTPVSEAARLLLSSTYTGLPVVNEDGRPVGLISQGDLIYRGGMPMRLGLMAESDREKVEEFMSALALKQASEVMTQPPVCIGQEKLVTEAVELMLKKKVKRLPVTDKEGRLVGILSRVDIFRSVMTVCPDWAAFQEKDIRVEGLRRVSDIMRRDTSTVLPDAPVEEVMRVIDCNDIQRVCVVDKEGRFLGIISDNDLLIAFADRYPGIWDYFVARIPFTERGRRHKELRTHLSAKTAADVMNTQVVTVREDTTIEEAICFILEKSIKRLPVLDADGKFKGMISRESLLRTIFASY